jgi:hypothetical protein
MAFELLTLVSSRRSPTQDHGVDGGARSGPPMTIIESLVCVQAVDLTLRLSFCRFHERIFEPKFGRQKALENEMFSRAC